MKKPFVVAVVGSKSSGKTTTMEMLIKALCARGYRIAAVKHIPEPDFTIDTKGKDTWRFAEAGAKTIATVASGEVAVIEKTSNSLSLSQILQRCRDNDLILLEGFKKLVAAQKSISKVVVVKSAQETKEAEKSFTPILAFTGPFSTKDLGSKIPYVDVLKEAEMLADLVERSMRRRG